MNEIKTWRDLAEAILSLPEKEQSQPIQCVRFSANEEEIQVCQPAYGFFQIQECFEKCRSAYDNKYHGADWVLLIDCNPFTEDGATGFNLDPHSDDWIGAPVYGKDGPTPPHLQCKEKNACPQNI